MVKKTIACNKLLTFMITNHVFVGYEDIPNYLNEVKINDGRDYLKLV